MVCITNWLEPEFRTAPQRMQRPHVQGSNYKRRRPPDSTRRGHHMRSDKNAYWVVRIATHETQEEAFRRFNWPHAGFVR